MKNFKFYQLILILLVLSACTPVETPILFTESPSPVEPTNPAITATVSSVITAITPTKSRERIDDPNDFIGLTYPPYPEEVTLKAGVLIDLSGARWGVESFDYNSKYMLWLSEIIGYDGGKAINVVRDVLVIEQFGTDQAIPINQCFINGEYDAEVFVMVIADQESVLRMYIDNKSLDRAWRANRHTGRFEEISTTGIDCYPDSWLLP